MTIADRDLSPSASIIVPTRARLPYLEVALASVAPQALAAGAELIVVDDDRACEPARALALRFGAQYLALGAPRGLNAARNAGIDSSRAELLIFIDDDVEVRSGWLAALLAVARDAPLLDVITGPIRPRLEGRAPRSCGREGPPITSCDLGDVDRDAPYAWGANMTIRRSALARVGRFDETIEQGGDEQELQDRLRASGSPAPRYVAAAAVDHRRAGRDAGLASLARGAYRRGCAARSFDARRGVAPRQRSEAIVLAGCVGHVLRYRCPAGLVMVAHSVGRLRAALKRSPSPAALVADDFLSGHSGVVGGLDGLRRRGLDGALDAVEIASARRLRLARVARRRTPVLSVLAVSIVRPQHQALADAIEHELRRSRHRLDWHAAPPGSAGKFENVNALLAQHPAAGHDWLLIVDDDIALPGGFLDSFLFLAERFGLSLAQPAHRLYSHAAWEVTRRRAHSTVRETAFVEIGPLTALRRETFPVLLPFPQLRMGWGLDMHWAALAQEHGWRCGVVDAVPISHLAAPAADAYSREAAIAEARALLADRPYLTAAQAGRTLATHRSW